eukprot:TRINITY_DN46442_c0_g1_i1.p1 TRINITY_DN46442_c0_g1~~TRINITY_DN46442_c0_g1_i1.p1  ORF type:complete len:835 (-),score=284.79 TRINITY_DN46442_c0_g1_i1:165-2669(-)
MPQHGRRAGSWRLSLRVAATCLAELALSGRLADEELLADCDTYMSVTGCSWTEKFSCPGQPTGSRGAAISDGSHGYSCCCGQGMWREAAAAETRLTRRHSRPALLEEQEMSSEAGSGLSVEERIARRAEEIFAASRHGSTPRSKDAKDADDMIDDGNVKHASLREQGEIEASAASMDKASDRIDKRVSALIAERSEPAAQATASLSPEAASTQPSSARKPGIGTEAPWGESYLPPAAMAAAPSLLQGLPADRLSMLQAPAGRSSRRAGSLLEQSSQDLSAHDSAELKADLESLKQEVMQSFHQRYSPEAQKIPDASRTAVAAMMQPGEAQTPAVPAQGASDMAAALQELRNEVAGLRREPRASDVRQKQEATDALVELQAREAVVKAEEAAAKAEKMGERNVALQKENVDLATQMVSMKEQLSTFQEQQKRQRELDKQEQEASRQREQPGMWRRRDNSPEGLRSSSSPRSSSGFSSPSLVELSGDASSSSTAAASSGEDMEASNIDYTQLEPAEAERLRLEREEALIDMEQAKVSKDGASLLQRVAELNQKKVEHDMRELTSEGAFYQQAREKQMRDVASLMLKDPAAAKVQQASLVEQENRHEQHVSEVSKRMREQQETVSKTRTQATAAEKGAFMEQRHAELEMKLVRLDGQYAQKAIRFASLGSEDKAKQQSQHAVEEQEYKFERSALTESLKTMEREAAGATLAPQPAPASLLEEETKSRSEPLAVAPTGVQLASVRQEPAPPPQPQNPKQQVLLQTLQQPTSAAPLENAAPQAALLQVNATVAQLPLPKVAAAPVVASAAAQDEATFLQRKAALEAQLAEVMRQQQLER